MSKYIKNLETGKIELHFVKSDYDALSDELKRELKSAYLWSNYGKCWVSRAKDPNTYYAVRVAEKLGFTECEKTGERISFAEQMERKAERAEARADRYEEYAANAERRAENLQKPLNNMRGDIAFFTQPIIAGHSGSQAFARCRQRMYDKYERGMDEYRKSEYYNNRAETARATASNAKLTDAIYLDNRMRECNKNLKAYQGQIVSLEESIYKIQHGETLRNYRGEEITVETLEQRIEDVTDRYEAEQDKLNFFEDCMQKLGGVRFSNENIKAGYVVEIARWGRCEVVGAGPKNITYKILDGGAAGGVLTDSYAAIVKIIAEKTEQPVINPFVAGDVLCLERPADASIYRAFQVIKATEKSVQIQEIAVSNGIPQANQFRTGSKPERKGIVKSKFSDYVGAYYDDWQMHKYAPKAAEQTA